MSTVTRQVFGSRGLRAYVQIFHHSQDTSGTDKGQAKRLLTCNLKGRRVRVTMVAVDMQ